MLFSEKNKRMLRLHLQDPEIMIAIVNRIYSTNN